MKALVGPGQMIFAMLFMVVVFIGLAWTLGLFAALVVRAFQWALGL
jgi:predicted RND superfamily exporter protein